MIGDMLILSAGLGLLILLGIAGKWRVEHDAKLAKKQAEQKAEQQTEKKNEDER